MRMWLVDPGVLCRKHLLGEHVELHMLRACIAKGKSIKGYADKGIVEPLSIDKRHGELVEEMLKRGYRHNSPISSPDLGVLCSKLPDKVKFTRVNKDDSLNELINRCGECKKRYASSKNNY